VRTTQIASSVALVFVVVALSGISTHPQSERDRSQLRSVHGLVLDRRQTPIPNGIVYLRNKSNNNVRTHISDSQGHYQFSGLNPNDDFEIYAEYKHHKSSSHTISSFESRHDIQLDLIIPIN
jgi:hypothetical protein